MLLRKQTVRPGTPGTTNSAGAHQWGTWDSYLFEFLHKTEHEIEGELGSTLACPPEDGTLLTLPDIFLSQRSQRTDPTDSGKSPKTRKNRQRLLSLFADTTLRRFPLAQKKETND